MRPGCTHVDLALHLVSYGLFAHMHFLVRPGRTCVYSALCTVNHGLRLVRIEVCMDMCISMIFARDLLSHSS